MRELNLEQIQLIALFLVVAVFLIVLTYAAISRPRRLQYGGMSAGRQQRRVSSFNYISASTQVSSSLSPDMLNEDSPLVDAGDVETVAAE